MTTLAIIQIPTIASKMCRILQVSIAITAASTVVRPANNKYYSISYMVHIKATADDVCRRVWIQPRCSAWSNIQMLHMSFAYERDRLIS